MVNLTQAVLVYLAGLNLPVSPIPGPLGDFTVGTDQILTWNTARLGTQPDQKVFDAVTQQQVDAYSQKQSQASATAVLNGTDGVSTLHRAIIAAAGLTIAQVTAQLPGASIPPPKPPG